MLRRRHTLISLARGLARRGAPAVARLPGLRNVRSYIHRSDFLAGRSLNGNHGLYASYDEALRAVPGDPGGYDQDGMEDLAEPPEEGGVPPMPSSEYPVLFWLKPAIEDGARRLFDLGGYVGHVYYQYLPYLGLPDEFRWTIYDLPTITRAGEALARERAASHLRFVNRMEALDGSDILFAAGSLHYLREGSLHEALREARRRPRHVIVHRTALHPERSFVTMQAMVTKSGRIVFCPYVVAHRQRFVDELAPLGYRLVDGWDKPRPFDVPLHPECQMDTYSGLYFRLADEVRSAACR